MPELPIRKSVRFVIACVALAVTTGCQKDTTLSGTIVWGDGEPATELAGATVELRSVPDSTQSSDAAALVTCVGTVESSGRFELRVVGSDNRPPDGRYRGLVVAPKWSPSTVENQDELDRAPVPIMDARFEKFKTSGIEIQITPTTGPLTIQVARAK